MSVTLSGSNGVTTPADNLTGATSGTVTLQSAATTTAWTLTLPTTPGTVNYVLQTDGTGVTSWTPQTGGGGGSGNGTGGNIFLADYFGGF